MNNDKYLTVTQINKYIKYKLDTDENLSLVFIRGEISNFKNHSSGHLYFTIKDENSRILAVMFKNNALRLNFKPQDGSKVLITGKISVYEASGSYQVYVDEMMEDGIGNLYLEYEKLKKALSEKGYFDESHKKPIPKYPNKIGIITAATGAAIRDIITTIKRRYKNVELILFPSLVQGEGAKEDIVKNINLANSYDLDLIILGRGGGSIEDLWAFNEEIVADAIYNSNIPIISAVGHEIDFTISDFVADLRAATPTAAAELAVPNTIDLINNIKQYKLRSSKAIKTVLDINKKSITNILNSYVIKNPMNLYQGKTQKLDNLVEKLNYYFVNSIKDRNNKYVHLIHRLESLNPVNTLKRGYTITKINDKVVTDLKNIKSDDIITTKFNKGTIISKNDNTTFIV